VKHPLIAREGWPFLAAAIIAATLVTGYAGWGWSSPLWFAALFMLQFFRDPPRTPPPGDRLVTSPADGKVVFVGHSRDPYLERDALKISVFMNVFDVHSNRSPVSGRVEKTWYHAGSFLNAALDKASDANERAALWLKTSDGSDITCVQVAGLIARRILTYARTSDTLAIGQRYGFIRFGSRVDLYLPRESRPRAALGDKVRAGETVLADLPSAI
jgi:phosphatidylserine decarboxylase